jgi:hypothetical protein
MPDLKMVKACPNCDSTHLHYRKRTNDYHCIHCKSVFGELKIRPAHLQPRLGTLCPNCGSQYTHHMAIAGGPYRRCYACNTTFKLEKTRTIKRPALDRGLICVCSNCGNYNIRAYSDHWHCFNCHINFDNPVVRKYTIRKERTRRKLIREIRRCCRWSDQLSRTRKSTHHFHLTLKS